MKKNSIVTDDWEHCFICGKSGKNERHHCMHGSNRKQAEKYGLTVPLCHGCHFTLHNNNSKLDKYVMQYSQLVFEKKYSYEKWMKVFRKNYR